MPEKKRDPMKTIDVAAASILFIGGVNWGLVGLFGFNLVAWIFGEMSMLTRIIYVLVGVSAIYDAVMWKAIQKRWKCEGSWSPAEGAST